MARHGKRRCPQPRVQRRHSDPNLCAKRLLRLPASSVSRDNACSFLLTAPMGTRFSILIIHPLILPNPPALNPHGLPVSLTVEL